MTAISRAVVFLIALAVTTGAAQAQSTLLQGGAITAGHVPMYVNSYSQQPVVQDSGPASGGGNGIGLSELGLTVRGAGTAPYLNAGTGDYNTNLCDNDGPITSAAGYHSLCFGPYSSGTGFTGGVISYTAHGTATPEPLTIIVNGQTFSFPGSSTCTGCGTMASQNYNSVSITGGSITNTLITANSGVGIPLINDTTGSTFSAPVDMNLAVVVNKGTPSSTTVVLPAASNWPGCPSSSQSACPVYLIKDGAGNAGTYNIVIDAQDGKTIDGASTYTMNTNWENVEIIFNGTNWNVF